MFDFLGFKRLRQALGTDGLYELYQNGLSPLIKHAAARRGKTIQQGTKPLFVPEVGPHSIEHRVVSDSILLFSSSNTFDDFLKIVDASHRLLCSGFAGHKVPLRGAIGYGDLILDPQSIWIGSAIEDAYIAERNQVWAGCRLTEQCEIFVRTEGLYESYRSRISETARNEADPIKKQNLAKAARRLVSYQIPLQNNPKDGPVQYTNRQGFALDWTTNVGNGVAEKAFSPSDNTHSQRIQANTLAFEKWARTRPDES